MTRPSLLVKRSIKSAASVAKAGFGFSRVPRGSIYVVTYHRVVADIVKAEREAVYGIVVSTPTFRRHCELLRRAFDVVSLETAIHFLEGRRTVARPLAVITFDDGYRDFFDEAFPVLNEFGLPATMFLPTGYIGKDLPLPHDRIFWLLRLAIKRSASVGVALNRAGVHNSRCDEQLRNGKLLKATDSLVHLPDQVREKVIAELERELGDKLEPYPEEYQLLDWDKVREMSKKGINFGSHTVNHVVLPLESQSVIRAELEKSKSDLEGHIGKQVISFAYPNGEYDPRVRAATSEAGYGVAVTTESKVNRSGSDLFSIGRTSLCEESTRGINGAYSHRVAGLRLGV